MEDILALVLIFGGGACIALSFSPIGRALADRIRGKSAGTGADELRAEVAEHKQALADELEAVRRELGELAERVDFTERLLAELDELKRRMAEAEERLDFTERLLAKERDGQRLARPH